MTDWLEDSLAVSISELRELGMSSIADDLGRLLASGSVADLRLYRNTELAGATELLDDIDDVVDLKILLHRLADVLEVDHMTLHCCSAKAANSFAVRVVTTYPRAWVDHYVKRSYSIVDPILARAETSAVGFYWDSVDFSFPVVAEFRKAAIQAGIGPSGYTLPVLFENDIRIACTVTSTACSEVFRNNFSRLEQDLRLLMEPLGDAYFRVAGRVRPTDHALDELRFRFLLGLSRGKPLEDLCRELGVDVATMTERVCEFYETRTLWQALAQSIRAGHLDEWPFDASEIHS